MLYIDDVGNKTIRFSDEPNGSGGYERFLHNNLSARSDEIGRVWVSDTDTGHHIINIQKPTLINLEGTVYTSAGNFVQAFNAMIAEEALVLATTTTTTAAATTTTTA